MIAKEKAKEIVDKYVILLHKETPCVFDFNKAIQCALIAVDEIINNGNLEPQLKRHIGNVPPLVIHLEYWEEVKQEIQNL